MYLTKCVKVASVLLVLGATTSGVGFVAQKGTQVASAQPAANKRAAPAGEVPAITVKPGKLTVRVTEKGSLEALQTADVYSRIEAPTTIIVLKPEGSAVKEGEIVCQLDSAALKDQFVRQRETERSAETSHKKARLARGVAELAITEYVEGTYRSEMRGLADAEDAAKSAVRRAVSRLSRTEGANTRVRELLAAKGAAAITPADIVAEIEILDRLESARLALRRERSKLDQAEQRRARLEQITLPLTVAELKGTLERARAAELTSKTTWELETRKGKSIERQIAACDIKAPGDGIIVYANDPGRSFARVRTQIEEGATVRERQKILSVVDVKGPMQVSAKIPEAQIDQLARGMKAKIRVDAFLSAVFDGTVTDIAPLPDATNFLNADIKVYTTKVKIDRRLPDLKPGMTASVDILVSEHDNVLSVPVEAVVSYGGKDHLAVKKPDGSVEWREVRLGQSNERVVEVKEGIKEGEAVATEPQELLSAEQKRAMRIGPARPAGRAKRRIQVKSQTPRD